MKRKTCHALAAVTASATFVGVGCGIGGGGELNTIVDGEATDSHFDASAGQKDGAPGGDGTLPDIDGSGDEVDTQLDTGAGDATGTPDRMVGTGGPDASNDSASPPPDGATEAGVDAMTPDGTVDATSSDGSPAEGGDAGDGGPPVDGSGPADASDAANSGDGPSDSAAETGDGTTACDFGGTWAGRLTIDVDWMPQGIMSVILASGSGTIRQWIMTTNSVSGTTMTETTTVCGVALPDFQSTNIQPPAETYGVRFPDSLFSGTMIPTFTATGTLSGNTPGSTLTTQPAAALLGITMANPTTDPWPSSLTLDGGVTGVTIDVATGSGYSYVPVDLFKISRADQLIVAIRQVTQITATYSDCDHLSGTVAIPRIPNTSSGKYAIDSHILGCDLVGGNGPCNGSQTSFLDGTQPVFTPSGPTSFTSMRIAANSTCAMVRQALP